MVYMYMLLSVIGILKKHSENTTAYCYHEFKIKITNRSYSVVLQLKCLQNGFLMRTYYMIICCMLTLACYQNMFDISTSAYL